MAAHAVQRTVREIVFGNCGRSGDAADYVPIYVARRGGAVGTRRYGDGVPALEDATAVCTVHDTDPGDDDCAVSAAIPASERAVCVERRADGMCDCGDGALLS